MAIAIGLIAIGALTVYLWGRQSPYKQEKSSWLCIAGFLGVISGIVRALWAMGVI